MFKVNKKDIATIATISVLEITKIKENMGMNWDLCVKVSKYEVLKIKNVIFESYLYENFNIIKF